MLSNITLFADLLSQLPSVLAQEAPSVEPGWLASWWQAIVNFVMGIPDWPEAIYAFLVKTWNVFLQKTVWLNLWKTVQMVFIAGGITIAFGVPLGILLNVTDKGGLKQNAAVNRSLGMMVNIGRSIPFIIFVFILMGVTKWLVGGTIGVKGAIVPLTVSAVPFMARLTETALKEVPQGLVEAAHSMGATPMQIICKVLLPEALPGIISALTIMMVSMIDYSAMAGMVGAGGLGDYAINHGYQRGRPEVIFAAVIVIVLLVQVTQWAGDWLARKVNHR